LGGTVTAVATSSITVQDHSNASRVVTVTGSTTIEVITSTSTPPVAGTMANVIVNALVTIQGTNGQNGSFTAKDIKVGVPPPSMMSPMYGEDGQDSNDTQGDH
jgi:hypothetical protein